MVTIAVVAICTLVHIAMTAMGGVEAGMHDMAASGKDTLEYFAQHPYLNPPPKLAGWLAEELTADQKAALTEAHNHPPPPDTDVAAQQVELERRFASLERAIQNAPVYKYGFVPRLNNWVGLFTSMFMHGGWLHLLGNLWMLWLCGCNLEDRWGRPVYALVYLVSGVVAALTHKLFFPISFAPLVGASGAIAGAMGGFLVVFAQTRIRFFYFVYALMRFYTGTFMARAFWMLGLWGAWEVFSAVFLSGSSGVAHWAHVGGFATGVVAALGLRYTGLEAKLDAAEDDKLAVRQDPKIEEAMAHLDAGRADTALMILERLLRPDPNRADVLLALLTVAGKTGDEAAQAKAYNGLLRHHFQNGEIDAATALFEEPKSPGVTARLAPDLMFQMAKHWWAQKHWKNVISATGSLVEKGLMDEVSVHAAVLRGAAFMHTQQLGDARQLLTAAVESPFATVEVDSMAREHLAELNRKDLGTGLDVTF
ncbi:MAG: rhomboid family intramembrane serine protease [Polyangiaceae bacterium]|nr:rhomboid family intramembrane serine protease [Polyangiaceae bacterium]